jgi:hypothetical protein
MSNDPALAVEVVKFFAGQVRELRARLEIQRIKGAHDRVLAWLRWRARFPARSLRVCAERQETDQASPGARVVIDS